MSESAEQPLRILQLTQGSRPGGVSRYLYDLCQGLQKRGHWVAIAGEHGEWHELFQDAPWPWFEVPMRGRARSLWNTAGRLTQFVREHQVQVLHGHYRKPMLAGRLVAWRCGVPLVGTLHVTDIAMSWLQRQLTVMGDCAHAPSQEARRWLIEVAHVPAKKIRVVPHGVDVEHYALADDQARAAARQALGLEPQHTVAAFVGRFDPFKNPLWLTELFDDQPHPQWRLVMMGGGILLEQLQAEFARRGLEQQVMLLPYGDPRPVYAAADLMLQPSSREGFMLSATEAMSCGTPVLRTMTAGAVEQIIEGQTGATTPVDRPAFLAKARQMLADRAALRQMGLRAAAHVRQNLTQGMQIDRTIEMYRQLIASRRGN